MNLEQKFLTSYKGLANSLYPQFVLDKLEVK